MNEKKNLYIEAIKRQLGYKEVNITEIKPEPISVLFGNPIREIIAEVKGISDSKSKCKIYWDDKENKMITAQCNKEKEE